MTNRKVIPLLLIVFFVIGFFVYFKLYHRSPGEFKEGIARLGMNSTVHLMCSCLFVSENEEAFCREYAQLRQVSPKISIDWSAKTVEARLFWVFSGRAQYVSLHEGCKLLTGD